MTSPTYDSPSVQECDHDRLLRALEEKDRIALDLNEANILLTTVREDRDAALAREREYQSKLNSQQSDEESYQAALEQIDWLQMNYDSLKEMVLEMPSGGTFFPKPISRAAYHLWWEMRDSSDSTYWDGERKTFKAYPQCIISPGSSNRYLWASPFAAAIPRLMTRFKWFNQEEGSKHLKWALAVATLGGLAWFTRLCF